MRLFLNTLRVLAHHARDQRAERQDAAELRRQMERARRNHGTRVAL